MDSGLLLENSRWTDMLEGLQKHMTFAEAFTDAVRQTRFNWLGAGASNIFLGFRISSTE